MFVARNAMDKDSLELLLEMGLSMEQIAKRVGRDASTISYWLRKFGLEAPLSAKHSSKGPLDRRELEAFVASGLSIVQIAEKVGRSPTAVRHWLAKYGLETAAAKRVRASRAARETGRLTIQLVCRHHGVTDFGLEGRGNYRCLRCRTDAVSKRRRTLKAQLVEEAGGACVICGYSRYAGALHFHHCDRSQKSFSLSELGLARSLDRARKEAAKCVLVCSNCHAEVENGVAQLPLP
jgi:transposase